MELLIGVDERQVKVLAKTIETTFNAALAEVFFEARGLSARNVFPENTQMLQSSSGKHVDVLVLAGDAPPVAVETEYKPKDPYADADVRLGEQLDQKHGGATIRHAVALQVEADGWPPTVSEIAEDLRAGGDVLRYKLLVEDTAGNRVEFPPSKGSYIEGNALDLVSFVRSVSDTPEDIKKLSDDVAEDIRGIAEYMNAQLSQNQQSQKIVKDISLAMGQTEPKHGLGVACVVWLDALMIQDKLSQHQFGKETVTPRASFLSQANNGQTILDSTKTKNEWDKIINKINYFSIFSPAHEALLYPPSALMSDVLGKLSDVALKIEKARLGANVNIGGELFGRVLQDRKGVAAFYTRPEVAAFLAELTIGDGEFLPAVSEHGGGRLVGR